MEKEEQFADELGKFAVKKAYELGLDGNEMMVNMARCLVITGVSCAGNQEDFTVALQSIRLMVEDAINLMERVIKNEKA